MDGWPQTAYSYAVVHPNNVSKLVIMDYIFAGFLPPEFGQNGPWWFAFHQVLNLPETLYKVKSENTFLGFIKALRLTQKLWPYFIKIIPNIFNLTSFLFWYSFKLYD
jgi:hypothetical protein